MTGNKQHVDHERKNSLLFKITCLYWLVAKIVGWRMFTANRLLPTAPVFGLFDKLPASLHLILFMWCVVLIVLAFFFPKNTFILPALLASEIASCMLDQNRWQPWEYQCIFTVFIYLFNRKNQSAIIPLLIIMLASTYFYSGCNKLNNGFLQSVWVPMILRSFFKVPLAVGRHAWLYYSGYLLAVFELAAGAGLLFPRSSKLAAQSLIMMHCFILLWLGPLGLNYNIIIWPWNILMILYLYFIFIKEHHNAGGSREIWMGWNNLVLLCWIILPALGIFGYWDSYLSSGIYSGKSPRMIICVSDPAKCPELKPFYNGNRQRFCGDGATIDFRAWAMIETNVLPNPEIRIYLQIQQKLEKRYAVAGLKCYIIEN